MRVWSRRGLVWIITAVFLLVNLNNSSLRPAEAGSNSRFMRIAAEVYPQISHLLGSAKVVIDYGSFYWLELPAAEISRLQSVVPSGYQVIDGAGIVSVMGYRFDPLAEGEPVTGKISAGDADQPDLYLVQFHGPIKDEWLSSLVSSGAQALQYYPNFAYLVWATPRQLDIISRQPAVRWTGAFHQAYKLAVGLRENVPADALAVTFFNDGHIDETIRQVAEIGGNILQTYPAQPDRRFLTAIVAAGSITPEQLAQLPVVWAIEPVSTSPGFDDEIGAQIIANNNPLGTPGSDYYAWLAAKGVDGSNISWAIVDTGLNGLHPDITGRAVAYVTYSGAPAANTDPDGHGSHTAGAIFGDGRNGTGMVDPAGFYWGTGSAPNASLVVQNVLAGIYWPPPGGWQVLSKDGVTSGAIGSNNSWYTGVAGAQGYSMVARTHDIMVREANFDTEGTAEPFIMVFSAGNGGDCVTVPCYTSITEPKEAKNLIVVGASSNYPRVGSSVKDIGSFSSRGPAQDGRLLPHVMAPGVKTASFNGSTLAGDQAICGSTVAGPGAAYYNYCSGTSMAAPFVSGAATLIADWWEQTGRGTPSPAMVKALLVNGAEDMAGGDNGFGTPNSHIPNNDQGWGLVNLENVIRSGVPTIYYDQQTLLQDTGDQFILSAMRADPTRPVRITLAWSDAPGAIGANPALVNDLDLVVTHANTTYYGNQFSNGWSVPGGASDRVNNIENIYLPNPAELLQIKILAAQIGGDGVPITGDETDQDFALVCYNCALKSDFMIAAIPSSQSVCQPAPAEYRVEVGSILGFVDPVTLAFNSVPSGTTTQFSPVAGIPPFTSTLSILDTGSATTGNYLFDVIGVAPTSTHTVTLGLDIYAGLPEQPDLLNPQNLSLNRSATPVYTWTPSNQAATYELQVATDPAFNDIALDVTGLSGSSYTPSIPLIANTQYYWRIRGRNACGAGLYSAVRTFITEAGSGLCSLGSRRVEVYGEDFEDSGMGWSHSADAGPDLWSLSAGRTRSGVQSFHAAGPGEDPYISDQRLVSPAIAMPEGLSRLSFQFWNYQSIERGANGCYDGALLEISTDGGDTWTEVPSADLLTDPYDGLVSSGFSNPLGDLPAWCGNPQNWLNSIVEVPQLAGQSARFRFRFGTDLSETSEGWYIDDVVVAGCEELAYIAALNPMSTSFGDLGSVVTHTLTLTNSGFADAYSVALNDSHWPAQLITTPIITLRAGETIEILVEVSIPESLEEALPGDTFSLTVTSHSEPSQHYHALGISALRSPNVYLPTIER